MLYIYNFIILFAAQILKFVALFSPKIKLFVNGRSTVFSELKQKIHKSDKTIWFHAASLGEYEQGLPVIQGLKSKFPAHKIIITFFSPSGYEVRKNNTIADVTLYLPLDTIKNARKFIEIANPEFVFFIKYEFWPNYLRELKSKNINTYLISGILRKDQRFFKWYGGFFRKGLFAFTHFFVQNERSKVLLQDIGFQNVTLSGDTRFDRVAAILEQNNQLDFISNFKNNSPLIVIGSSWEQDEKLWLEYINSTTNKVKFIIAPHNIYPEKNTNFIEKCNKKTVLFSQKESKNLEEFQVFIIDTIGILTKIYAYSDLAYVGGGFGNPGVHNILEPATFGVPVLIGPNYSHFAEATALVQTKGCTVISNQLELKNAVDFLLQNEVERMEQGHICETFIQMNKGATHKIVTYFENHF